MKPDSRAREIARYDKPTAAPPQVSRYLGSRPQARSRGAWQIRRLDQRNQFIAIGWHGLSESSARCRGIRLWRSDDPCSRTCHTPPLPLGLVPYHQSMIGLLWQGIRPKLLAGRLKFGDRQGDDPEAVVASKYVVGITTRSGDHHRHRLIQRVVVEGRTVGSVLPWLFGEVVRRDTTPHFRVGSNIALPGRHRSRRVSRPRSWLLAGAYPPHR